MLVPAFKETKNDMMPGTAEREAFDDVLKQVAEGTWHDKEVVLQTICDYFSLTWHTKPADAVAALKVIAVVDKTPTKMKLAKNESDACFAILDGNVEGVYKKAALQFIGKKIRTKQDEDERMEIIDTFVHYMKGSHDYAPYNELCMIAPVFRKICVDLSKDKNAEVRYQVVDQLGSILEKYAGKKTDFALDGKYFLPAMRSFDKDENPIIRKKARASIADFETRYRKETSAKQMMQPT